jgi:hypothetical protein
MAGRFANSLFRRNGSRPLIIWVTDSQVVRYCGLRTDAYNLSQPGTVLATLAATNSADFTGAIVRQRGDICYGM